jgi:hypothetical protein
MAAHRQTALAQRSGICERRTSRARTSSARFVSCVDVASIVPGCVAAVSAFRRWNASTVVPKRAGSPPTSFSATSRP